MKKALSILIKLSRRDIFILSIVVSLFTFSISSVIHELWIFVDEVVLNNPSKYEQADFSGLGIFLLVYTIFIGPTIETILLLILYYISKILLSRFWSGCIAAMVISAYHMAGAGIEIHGITQAILAFPPFFIFILLFIIMQRRQSGSGILPILFIHMLHNSYVVLAIYISSKV